MRIALVTESFFPTVDGVTSTVKAVADRTIEAGHDVRFVAPGPGLALYRNSRVERISPIGKTGRQVRDALADFAPDAVIAFDPGRLGRKALAAASGRATTMVVQQSAVSAKAAATWDTGVAAYADDVLVTSEWLRGRLAALEVPASVWEPGVDCAAFAPTLRDDWLHRRWSKAKSRETPLVVVGYAGRLSKQNGVRRLAELTSIPNIRLVIIGDGKQRGWLEQRIPQAKLTGPLGTGDLAVALASLDVLVHPGEE
ncbi:MAG: glycosyltransferase, partial [Nocardioides sp.]|nr:glycosyltransferase [Nocardioides sp.]